MKYDMTQSDTQKTGVKRNMGKSIITKVLVFLLLRRPLAMLKILLTTGRILTQVWIVRKAILRVIR